MGATLGAKPAISCDWPICKSQKNKTDRSLELGRFTLRTRRSGVRIPEFTRLSLAGARHSFPQSLSGLQLQLPVLTTPASPTWTAPALASSSAHTQRLTRAEARSSC